MFMLRILIVAISFHPSFSFSFSPQKPLRTSLPQNGSPTQGPACINANLIFNSIHSSMRQWGSSLKHNGMSLFPARVPAGVTLYHGTRTPTPVTSMEWLAFEIEHAELFARGFRGGPPGAPGEGPPRGPPNMPQLSLLDDPESSDDLLPVFGYLHFYRTTRPLNLLYIDGMSAGKTTMGTLDTQDLLLLGHNSTEPMRDLERAADLCKLGAAWGVEGFIRMETGFEIIKCNFSEGLEFVSAARRPQMGSVESQNTLQMFEYVRGVGMRYEGIGAQRVTLDYSSMVSPYFYDVNITNPDVEKASLPRLLSADPLQLKQIRSDLVEALQRPKTHASVDWQGIVDMIVGRYAFRLQFLSTRTNQSEMISELNNLLNPFIDYSDLSIPTSTAICTTHYLAPAQPSTPQDDLIHHSISTVSERICNTLFTVRDALLSTEDLGAAERQASAASAADAVRDLIAWLDWSAWKRCGPCDYDRVCFVAMWPFGAPEDHESPGCRSSTEIMGRGGYWGRFGPGRPPEK